MQAEQDPHPTKTAGSGPEKRGMQAEGRMREFKVPACLPSVGSSGLDRLLHHAEVLIVTGPSFRAQGRHQLEQELLIAQPALS